MIYKIKSNGKDNDIDAIEIELTGNRVTIENQGLNLDTLDWECSSYISIDVNEFLFVAEQIKKSFNKNRGK